ncbi:MAG TPA: penicillin-binding transpeptidase domain-containing protein [Longimicrobiaceae bacterium]|nr:penicillin-binding transpeptidase domain-containing protein [Longimicrobiaceae bacterium]
MSRRAGARGGGRGDFLIFRRRILLCSFGIAAVAVLGRAFQLQALQGEKWRAEAVEQQQSRVPVPARRGGIFDRDGTPLALSYETFRISVAPGELADRGEAAAALRRVLGVSESAARRATGSRRAWVVLPGRFTAEQRRRLEGIRGIHSERRLERFYPQGDVGREVLGIVSADGRALGGIEQEMNDVLRGTDGLAVLRRDAHGKAEPSMALPVVAPRDGSDVYLTLDFDLQEIADGALREAVRSTGAEGGDLLISDPRTGEILAAVSHRAGGGRTLAGVTEPYEPGSTLKPLFIASLLAHGRVSLDETVFAENGRWTDAHGRTVTDVHPYGTLSVREALRESSNVAMAKLSPRLPAAEQYGSLRDFGLGTPTGVEYPSEAGGRLRRPDRWSRLTPVSLAIGYEVAVTPLQLLMAYGALANGGTLMEPRLVREVRAATGEPLRRWEPRAVRRVLPERITEQLREVLVSVVEEGTATRASLATFDVAGKTGTARLTGAAGRYESGSYASTFVGFFPARTPQLAIYVKINRPRGEYYGGLTAAPVTRETLHAILAARSSALDRASLVAARRTGAGPARMAAGGNGAPPPDQEGGTYVFHLAGSGPPRPADGRRGTVAVPALEGLPLRDAARRAHALGLRVHLRGTGRVRGTEPAAGAQLPAGDTLVLVGGEQ